MEILPCIQLNMHKALQAAIELGHLLTSQPGIAFLQEPYTAYTKVVSIPKGLSLHVGTSDNGSPRAALLIPKRYQALSVEHLCTRDSAAACIRIQGRTVLLASVYMDSTLPVIQPWLENIIEFADSKNIPLVLGADSNCHSHLFGDDSNTRGEALELFLLTHSLEIQNIGTQPTFEVIRNGITYASCIDITITKDIDVYNWMVSQKFNGSDHHTIHFDLRVGSESSPMIRYWKETDWVLFGSMLEGGWDPPATMTIKKLDKQVKYLYSRINSALDISSPLCPVS